MAKKMKHYQVTLSLGLDAYSAKEAAKQFFRMIEQNDGLNKVLAVEGTITKTGAFRKKGTPKVQKVDREVARKTYQLSGDEAKAVEDLAAEHGDAKLTA